MSGLFRNGSLFLILSLLFLTTQLLLLLGSRSEHLRFQIRRPTVRIVIRRSNNLHALFLLFYHLWQAQYLNFFDFSTNCAALVSLQRHRRTSIQIRTLCFLIFPLSFSILISFSWKWFLLTFTILKYLILLLSSIRIFKYLTWAVKIGSFANWHFVIGGSWGSGWTVQGRYEGCCLQFKKMAFLYT